MLNVLYKNIDWKNITAVGFDMDGTLYDEYNFITQAYTEINRQLIQDEAVLLFMCCRWIEKGSSYPHIFNEAFEKCNNNPNNQEEFIHKALCIFRNFVPQLSLSNRNKILLSYLQKNFDLFLITDGHYELQKNKYTSLGLSRYFQIENVVFTGKYSSDYHKPNTNSLNYINLNLDKSIYFGDRDIDKQFALSSCMQFQKVYNMVKVCA
jgi:FMN phosphatase YigB (HAD superfamily)